MRSSRETRNKEDIQEHTLLLINQLQLQQRRLERKLAKVQRRVKGDICAVDGEDHKAETQRERRSTRIVNSTSHNNE